MYEEFLKEKLMIDEIVRKIYEEDQRYVKVGAENHHHITTLLLSFANLTYHVHLPVTNFPSNSHQVVVYKLR